MKDGFLKNCLSKGGKVSSKRLVTFLCVIVFLLGYVTNLIWGLEPSDKYVDSIMYIIVGGLGFTASEQFSAKPDPVEEPYEDDYEES